MMWRVGASNARMITMMGVCSGFSRSYAQTSSTCDHPYGHDDLHPLLYRPIGLTKFDVPTNSIELDSTKPMRERMASMIKRVQDTICDELARIDGTPFREDKWTRKEGGEGRTRVLQNGKVFEKAGVNISIVQGNMSPQAVQYMKKRGKELESGRSLPYFACGISMVLHPHNPMAPTMHMNYRFFEVETGRTDDEGQVEKLAWFGGGADLTPSYLFDKDAKHFHAVYKKILDDIDPVLYPVMKKDCDEYFYIPHRQEHRGIGGIFYDDMEGDLEKGFKINRMCALAMLDAYIPILEKRMNSSYTDEQKCWQQVRRGRYVEFNLMYDRGTKFGLATPGARIESILMSLPLNPRFEYMNIPPKGSWEDYTMEVIKTPREWLGEENLDLSEISTGALFQELAKRSESSGRST